NFGGVGDLGAKVLASIPEQARAQVQPLIPAIVHGIHEAFSIATASTFVLGIGTALLACLVILVVLPATRMPTASAEAPESAAGLGRELEPSADRAVRGGLPIGLAVRAARFDPRAPRPRCRPAWPTARGTALRSASRDVVA